MFNDHLPDSSWVMMNNYLWVIIYEIKIKIEKKWNKKKLILTLILMKNVKTSKINTKNKKPKEKNSCS